MNKNPPINKNIDIRSSYHGTPNEILTIITTGEVKGINEHQKASSLWGLLIMLCAIINAKINGIVIGKINQKRFEKHATDFMKSKSHESQDHLESDFKIQQTDGKNIRI